MKNDDKRKFQGRRKLIAIRRAPCKSQNQKEFLDHRLEINTAQSLRHEKVRLKHNHCFFDQKISPELRAITLQQFLLIKQDFQRQK